MPQISALFSFKTKLQQGGMRPLADAFDRIETRLAKVGFAIVTFKAPAPRDAAKRQALLQAFEAKFKGQLPAELRKGLLDFYAIADGFSVVVGPANSKGPLSPGAVREDWIDRPIGYHVLPFAKTIKWVSQFVVDQDSAPRYEEGGLRQLFNSDLKKGEKPDTAALRYSSYLDLNEDNKLDWSTYCNESYAAHSLALGNDTFPGGYLDADGDQQPFLMLDDAGAPLRIPFAELLAAELYESIGHFLEAAEVSDPSS